ncbi:MAG: regulatory protein RecX [Flavobacteriales bacterium]
MKNISLTVNQAREKIQRYCAYRERCQYEVREKLFSFGLHTNEVESLMAELIIGNFLNEERFARAYCSGKFRIKKWGKNKIKSNLKGLRIPDYLIKSGLTEIDGDEYFSTLCALVKKKFSSVTGAEWQRKLKTIAFLNGKGFETDLIKDAFSFIAEHP